MKVGVFVDAENLNRCGGFRARYGILRDFACRDGAEPAHLNLYLAYDADRARQDDEYRVRAAAFHTALRRQGFKVCIKEIHWYQGENGRYAKANADLDLAVDALCQADGLGRVLLATGDGDFVRVIQALQSRGCRVEVVGLDHVSMALRQEANLFFSGYLIPGFIPIAGSQGTPEWGEPGSRVRGWCAVHNPNYGFFRFLKKASDLPTCSQLFFPYVSAFFHDSQLPASIHPRVLPSRTAVFEFTLVDKARGFAASDILLVNSNS